MIGLHCGERERVSLAPSRAICLRLSLLSLSLPLIRHPTCDGPPKTICERPFSRFLVYVYVSAYIYVYKLAQSLCVSLVIKRPAIFNKEPPVVVAVISRARTRVSFSLFRENEGEGGVYSAVAVINYVL